MEEENIISAAARGLREPRQRGVVVSWKGDFGFIRSADSPSDIFAHIDGLRYPYRNPQLGDVVTYRLGRFKDRAVAVDVDIVGGES